MTEVREGALTFQFSEDCEVTKYDEWDFFKNRFQRIKDGTKAVDFLCVEPGVAWLIEVKDYREHERTKPSELSEEIAGKVRDTLSGLAAASANAEKIEEMKIAKRALRRRCWRVVLHLEHQWPTGSKLWPRGFDDAKILQKLRGRLNAVDPNAMVRSQYSAPGEVPWKVNDSSKT